MKEEKKKINAKTRAMRIFAGMAFLAFLVTAAVYASLLRMEREMIQTEETVIVWSLCKEWNKGFFLEQDGLVLIEIPKRIVPDGAFGKEDAIPEGRAVATFGAGTILTSNLIEPVDAAALQMKEPVVVAVEVSDYLSAAGGILEAGDRVDLLFWKEEELLGEYKNLVVQSVLDSGGNLQTGASDKAVNRFTVYLERQQVQQFYAYQQEGKVRAAKLVWEN